LIQIFPNLSIIQSEDNMSKSLTINEALTWKKTLETRHAELQGLRNENSAIRTSYRGLKGDTAETIKPTYDVVALDSLVSRLAREVRKLDMAIKSTNAVAIVNGYEYDEDILGELVPAAKE
jgi:hypothetical protein